MAQATPEIKTIIDRYLRQLAKQGIHVERVLIFGSHSTGSAREDSDIDLIVISPDWETLNQRERLELLGVAAARILEPIQANGFTPREISQRAIMPFWKYIIEEQAVPV